MAEIFEDQGNYEAGIASVKKAIAINPGFGDRIL
jgi:hypothetical protein